MFNYKTLAGALALASLTSAAPSWPSQGGWSSKGRPVKQAAYFLRVDPAGSTIIAATIGSNGLLAQPVTSTGTGGVGLQSKNASAPNMAPTGGDPLQGQQAVLVANNYLFTVNSGSNTATMFTIDPANPTSLKMTGKPVNTLGEFPMSVAYSTKYNKLCVLNAGAKNGVACFIADGTSGLTADGMGFRSFGMNATTPPIFGGPLGSASAIQFSPDSSKLVATVKGNNKPATLGHVLVYSVGSNGSVPMTATDNSFAPLTAAFGLAMDTTSPPNVFVSVAGFGGALLSFENDSNGLSLVKTINSTSFGASCWAVYDLSTDKFYNINAATPTIGVSDPTTGALDAVMSYNKTLGGGFDTAISGENLYFLSATNELGVFNLASGKLVQAFPYATASDRQFWTGMAVYPSEKLLSGGM